MSCWLRGTAPLLCQVCGALQADLQAHGERTQATEQQHLGREGSTETNPKGSEGKKPPRSRWHSPETLQPRGFSYLQVYENLLHLL